MSFRAALLSLLLRFLPAVCACVLTLCPMNLNALSCGLKFQIMTTWSAAPDASCLREGLNDTEVTAPLCPRNERSNVGSLDTAAPDDVSAGADREAMLQTMRGGTAAAAATASGAAF